MSSDTVYDVVVIGGGPVGLAAAYEAAKANAKVLILEKNNFFNQAGSSGDLARMFRTMYTEDFMADLAKDALDIWDELEKDSSTSLRWMNGLLNFGDADLGEGTPEGTLLGPKDNLIRLGMSFKQYDKAQIEAKYPFKNLPDKWEGLYAPDNGVINVQLLLRTLLSLAKDYGAAAKQNTLVEGIAPCAEDNTKWTVSTLRGEDHVNYTTKKIIITSGAYVNHVLRPSFGFSLDLDIWEMVASYFNTNAGPNGTIFPSMWFQFAPDKKDPDRSQLFYGFPALPWGPPNVVRIAVDAARNRIKDPDERHTSEINAQDIADCQEFIKNHIDGVDSTVPASSLTCLQTNVFDNMFVLDYIPENYLGGGPKDSIAVFTAGWAMKFVPLLGRALAEMALKGGSSYAREEFKITRTDPSTGKGIIVDEMVYASDSKPSAFTFSQQASGSSIKGVHNVGS